MSIFTNIWSFFKRKFKYIERHADVVAITVTEQIKVAMSAGVTGFIADIVDNLTKSHIASEIVTFLRNNIGKVLAAELALQGLPDNPTADDILNFEKSILTAFGKLDNKSKLYTTLAAQIYGLIDTTLKATPDTPPTFAEWVKVVEQAYLDYLADKQENNDQ